MQPSINHSFTDMHGQMHNNTHLVAPLHTSLLYQLYQIGALYHPPYPELVLDRWMKQNSQFYTPTTPLPLSNWANASIQPSKCADKMPPCEN